MPVAVSAREFLGRDPKLDPRLRIFVVDDPTIASVGDRDVSLAKWAEIFEYFAKAKPSAIYLDRFFGNPIGMERSQEFVERVKALHVPVFIGSFAREVELEAKGDDALAASALVSLKSLSRQATAYDEVATELAWLPVQTAKLLYSADHRISDAFAGVGHLKFDDSSYSMPAMWRIDADRALPPLAFLGAKSLHADAGHLFVNGNRLPVDEFGNWSLNFASLRSYHKRAKSLSRVLNDIVVGKPADDVAEEDFVLILPAHFTGHTDFKMTPIGRIAGGYAIATSINDVLTGRFLRPVGGGSLLVPALAAVGFLLALRLSIGFFAGALLGAIVVAVASGLALFAYFNLVVSWLYPVGALTTAAVFAFITKAWHHERATRRITAALSGFVAPDRLKEIVNDPTLLMTEPCGRTVTVIFIDMIGYSLVAERLPPKEAFSVLKEFLTVMTNCVHAHGGVVDKTMGDGLLCFFGYHYDGSRTVVDHATKAVECAVEIQRKILDRNLQVGDAGRPVFPLRIGINTAYVFIGDLGDERRIDFTLIGDGVNFAQRLESACEAYQIMVAPSTHDLLTNRASPDLRITRRFVQIKHHDELIEAYEVDPFELDAQRKSQAIRAYRDSLGVKRKDSRFAVPEHLMISASTDFSTGQLHDFSHKGVCLRMPKYVGKGVTLPLHLGEEGGHLRRDLQQAGLAPLLMEVRWGRPFRGEFLHGIALKNISEAQSEALVEILRAEVRRQVGTVAA